MEAGTNRTVAANRPASRIDALDRALLIFKHPPDVASGRLEPKYRRVDLVVSRPGSWGCAVVGVSPFLRLTRADPLGIVRLAADLKAKIRLSNQS